MIGATYSEMKGAADNVTKSAEAHQSSQTESPRIPNSDSSAYGAAYKDALGINNTYSTSSETNYNGTRLETTYNISSDNKDIDGYSYVRDENTGKTFYYDNNHQNITEEQFYNSLKDCVEIKN